MDNSSDIVLGDNVAFRSTDLNKKLQGNNEEDPQDKFGKIKIYHTKPPIVKVDDSILTVVKTMVDHRFDAAICVSDSGDIEGIITDKDICYKVVYQGFDLERTTAMDVMTPEPKTIMEDCRTSIALSFMVRHSIRHLPVLSITEDYSRGMSQDGKGNNASIGFAGIVDISTCVFDRLEDLEQKMYEDHSIVAALDVLERRGKIDCDSAVNARANLNVPDIDYLLSRFNYDSSILSPPKLSPSDTVFDAAVQMSQNHKTAVIIVNPDDSISGIFTTKDLLFRVISKDLDPHDTPLSSTATPRPICVDTSVSLISAINMMKEKSIKHLPVVKSGMCIAIIEVSELAMATLEYLFSNDGSNAGNALTNVSWKEFWDGSGNREKDRNSTSDKSNDYNMMGSYKQSTSSYAQPQKTQSVSSKAIYKQKSGTNSKLDTFNFKLRINNSKKALRFKSTYNSIRHIKSVVIKEIETCYNTLIADVDLCYKDFDGDEITLTSDKSLIEAIKMFIDAEKNSIELIVVGIELKKRDGVTPQPDPKLLPLLNVSQTDNVSSLNGGDQTHSKMPLTSVPVIGKVTDIDTVGLIRKYSNIVYMITPPILITSAFLIYAKLFSSRTRMAMNRSPERLLW